MPFFQMKLKKKQNKQTKETKKNVSRTTQIILHDYGLPVVR